MSPEQCRGSQVDNRSDIYSLACMLFESISGKLPFDSDNAIGLIHKHINDETPRLEAGKRSYPLELGSIIYKAMAKETENRYQSMTELESDLQHLLRNEFEQISAPVPINHRKAWNPAIFIALVASTLIIAFVLGFGFFSDPGFAAPMAGLLRGLRKEQSEQFASSYGQWLEKQNKPRGAELIYTSILSRQEKSALPPEEIADLWFILAKLQFQLSETNLGCRSLIRGMQILVKLPNQKKLLDYGPRIESLIRANFQCAISPPVEPSSKEMLKKSAHHFSRAAQMSVAEQLWRLILFTGRKDVELQITKCCENAADLRDDGRRDEARACLNVAEGRIRENMNQLNKPWLMRLYAQLSTEWFHMREYDKSRDYVYKAYVLGESGAKPDLSTQAALARCNADLLNQEGKTDESLRIYKSAFDLGKQLLDDNRSSLEYLAVYTEKLIDSAKRIEAKQALSDFLNTVEPTRFNHKNYIRCRLALAMVEIDLGQLAEAQKQLDLLNRELASETAELAPHFLYEVKLRLLLKEKNYPQFCQLLAKAKDELPKKHRGYIYILNDDLYALAKSNSAEVPWQTIQESCKLEALEPVEVVASLETAANLYSKDTMTEEKRIELLEGIVSKIVSLPISGQRKAEANYFQQHVVLAAQKLIKQHKYAETLDLLLAVQELEKIDKKYRQSARLLRAAIPN